MARLTRLLGIIFLLAASKNLIAQNQPFVQEEVIKTSGITQDAQIYNLTKEQKQTTRYYMDGLGRTVQTVILGASPQQNDIISTSSYNQVGRQTKSYLPYAGSNGDGAYRANAISEQAAFFSNGSGDKVADDPNPYSEQVFENSPLQRLLMEGSVGNGYQIGQHSKTITYRHNLLSDDVWRWQVGGSWNGSYPAATLSVHQITDEQENQILVFVNDNGQTILKRQLANETVNGAIETFSDTYYIYNAAGQCITVVPPKAVSLMRSTANWSLEQSAVSPLLFRFVYDDLGRIIEKTVPGSTPLYVVYDPLERPVLLQDGRLRAANKWNYIKYDAAGRSISQGIYTDATRTTRAAMQTYVNGLNYSSRWSENRSTASSSGYYTNLVFPTTGIEPLAYSYFDDYDLDRNGTPDYSYQVQGLNGEAASTALTRGQLTMVRKRTIGSGLGNIWLINMQFYDKRGNVIQVRSNNQLTTTVSDSKTMVPDFTGKVLQAKTVRSAGSAATTILSSYSYDHSDRLKALDESHNGAAAVRIAAYEYNELGQVVKKNLHKLNTPGQVAADVTLGPNNAIAAGGVQHIQASNSITLLPGFQAAQGSSFSAKIVSSSGYLQSVDYRYNIRGQLLSINNSTLTVDDKNGDSDDVFGMELLYEQTQAEIGNTGYYNGQISAVKWKAKDPQPGSPKERSYRFDYDQLNRLKNALYKERATGGSWGNAGAYDEKNIRYDQNGNILGLERNAYISGAITSMDNLSYTYTGNRLDNISDGGSQTLGYKNLSSSSAVYQHDAQGSLTLDPKKGVSMSYNVLSRAERVTVTTSTGRYISYTYDAVGVLLRKQAYDNNILQKTTDYVDGFVYENGTLSHFAMAEGRIRNTGSALKAEYMIADHQGNVRVSFEEENGLAVVRQENSYYPYGMIMPGGSLPTQPNRNLYNEGSEWQNDYGDLPDYYNTFYRNYDPATGRFISIDPKAEASEELSPYHYGGNNPVMFNDPLGDLYERGILEMEISQAAEAVWGRGGGGGSGSGGFNVGNGPYANFWGQFMSQTWRQTPSDGQYHNYTWNAFAGERLSEQQWLSQGGNAGQLQTATGFVQFYSGAWVRNNGSSGGIVGGDAWNTTSNSISALGFTVGAGEYQLGRVLEKRLAYQFTKAAYEGWKSPVGSTSFKTIIGTINADTKLVQRAATSLKVGGAVLGGIGVVMTGVEIYNGNKSLVGEGGFDLIMGGVGFIPGWGWAASGLYFGGKYLLQETGNDFWNK